jgi:hypothetical protein
MGFGRHVATRSEATLFSEEPAVLMKTKWDGFTDAFDQFPQTDYPFIFYENAIIIPFTNEKYGDECAATSTVHSGTGGNAEIGRGLGE